MAKQANYFEYDQEVFKASIETYEAQIEALESLMGQVDTAVENLRNDWNSDAGTEFFKTYDDDWKEIVNQYIELAKFLKQSIYLATLNFDPIIEEVEGIDL